MRISRLGSVLPFLDFKACRRPRSWTLQKGQIERREHQDNSDVHYQPLPEPVPEEQDVHADHNGYQREYVKHHSCLRCGISIRFGSLMSKITDAIQRPISALVPKADKRQTSR